MNNYVLVDWLSFSVPITPEAAQSALHGLEVIGRAFELWNGTTIPWAPHFDAFEPCKARAPYTDCWLHKESKTRFYFNRKLDHFLVEMSGQSMDYARENGIDQWLLKMAAERASRVDVAVDIHTDTRPQAFIAAGVSSRFKTQSQFMSDTGTTCYLGSMKSDRYARVYRYNEPHERSHLLRVEHVFRRKQAQAVCASILANGLNETASSLKEAFEWGSTEFNPPSDDTATVDWYRADRPEHKTLHWLRTQCAPAFRRLHAQGELEQPVEWLLQHFLDLPDDDIERIMSTGVFDKFSQE